MDVRVIAEALCRKQDTRSPFDLAASLGVLVLYEPLGEIQGYYNRCYRQRFIHINQALDGGEATFTCAHELAHAILHANLNTPFLRRNTLYSVDKLEQQANHLALEILYSDEELQPFLARPIADAAAYIGVPLPLARYRMSTVQPTLWAQYI